MCERNKHTTLVTQLGTINFGACIIWRLNSGRRAPCLLKNKTITDLLQSITQYTAISSNHKEQKHLLQLICIGYHFLKKTCYWPDYIHWQQFVPVERVV